MKKYTTIALTETEFREIIERRTGKLVNYVDYDMGGVTVDLCESDDKYLNASPIVAEEFGVADAYVFTSDTDQLLPSEIMVLLDYDPYERFHTKEETRT